VPSVSDSTGIGTGTVSFSIHTVQLKMFPAQFSNCTNLFWLEPNQDIHIHCIATLFQPRTVPVPVLVLSLTEGTFHCIQFIVLAYVQHGIIWNKKFLQISYERSDRHIFHWSEASYTLECSNRESPVISLLSRYLYT